MYVVAVAVVCVGGWLCVVCYGGLFTKTTEQSDACDNERERERQTDGRRTHLLAEELEADLRAGREVAQLHRVARPVLFVCSLGWSDGIE